MLNYFGKIYNIRFFGYKIKNEYYYLLGKILIQKF